MQRLVALSAFLFLIIGAPIARVSHQLTMAAHGTHGRPIVTDRTVRRRPIVTDRGVSIDFPFRLTFNAHVDSPADVGGVVLEYGVEKRTCGRVTAKAYPRVRPGSSVDVSWTWDMRESGAEPPGTTVWYRWVVTDSANRSVVSPEHHVLWLDTIHPWTSISRDRLTLHWYTGDRAFADDLLASATASLRRLGRATGVTPDRTIDLYVYATTDDLLNAVLYAPGWTGGLAFPDYSSVSIGISPAQATWGRIATAHELTHVLVGQLAFSCLSTIPTWLNEGTAVYGQGGPDATAQSQLDAAIAGNTLLSIHTLSGAFSEIRSTADLSYSESYSLVNYLVGGYGPLRLRHLFKDIQQGLRIEDALRDVYGFGLDGLEDRWRVSVHAAPRPSAQSSPAATALPTPIPTYPPLSDAPVGAPVGAASTHHGVNNASTSPAVSNDAAAPAPIAVGVAQTDSSLSVAWGLIILFAAGAISLFGYAVVRSRSRP